MKLTTSAQAGLPGTPETTASVAGDVLTVNGITYDLSLVPEGGEATPEGDHPFIGTITRTNGEIVATIIWSYGPGAATNQPVDPAYWVITLTDGPIPSLILLEGVPNAV